MKESVSAKSLKMLKRKYVYATKMQDNAYTNKWYDLRFKLQRYILK